MNNLLDKQQVVNLIYNSAPTPEYLPPGLNHLTNRQEYLSKIAQLIGVHSSDITKEGKLKFFNAGLNTLMVPVKDLDTLMSLNPKPEEMEEHLLDYNTDIIVVFTLGQNRVMRVFQSSIVDNEEASGSAAAALGYYFHTNLDHWNNLKIFEYTTDQIFKMIGLRWRSHRLSYTNISSEVGDIKLKRDFINRKAS